MKSKKVLALLTAILLIALPFLFQGLGSGDFLMRIAVMIGIYIILTLSLNIIVATPGSLLWDTPPFTG
ncbi:hypothetical protein [Cohnella kolymensis]|uniref:hypothetical protein n=1 Tax=Cohnella kolymensis TaxID=1590652 RepID=UPI00069825D8|nr:hypothetical protein [Cohnella kolymensis]